MTCSPRHRGQRQEYVRKGIKRNQTETGVKSKPRLPIIPTKLKSVWEPNAAILMIIMGSILSLFLRFFTLRGNDSACMATASMTAVHLSFSDMSFNHTSDHSVIQVHINHHRRQIHSERESLLIYLGRTNSHLRPVSALLGYLCALSRCAQ